MLDGTFKKFAPEYRGPRTGRIKCGTESNGGFINITISNCVFEGCQGYALETVDGALLEDITITNTTMRDLVFGANVHAPRRAPAGTEGEHEGGNPEACADQQSRMLQRADEVQFDSQRDSGLLPSRT